MKWNGDEAEKMIHEKAVGFVTMACIKVQDRAKVLLSIPGTVQKSGAAGPGSRPKGARITGAVRSEPGEPPRKQTGRLRGSVTYEVDDKSVVGRVGTNVKYGKALELGTKKGILPRPWLRRALAEMQAQVSQLLQQIGAK